MGQNNTSSGTQPTLHIYSLGAVCVCVCVLVPLQEQETAKPALLPSEAASAAALPTFDNSENHDVVRRKDMILPDLDSCAGSLSCVHIWRARPVRNSLPPGPALLSRLPLSTRASATLDEQTCSSARAGMVSDTGTDICAWQAWGVGARFVGKMLCKLRNNKSLLPLHSQTQTNKPRCMP